MSIVYWRRTVLQATSATLAMASGAMAEPLTYFTWAGYDDPSFREPYTAEYGEDGVAFSFFSSADEAFAKLQGGFEVDVAHACAHDVRKWTEAGLIRPIDTARLQNWNDLIPSLSGSDVVTVDGEQMMIPWEWGASSVIYRGDRVTVEGEPSYELLIDPQYSGRTAIIDAFDETYQLAAILAGVEEPLNLQEEEYPAVEEMMRRLRQNARFIWTDPAQLEQALAAGEVDLAWGWPNSYASLLAQGVPVEYMLEPREGLITWLCGFTIAAAADAPDEQIYDFIDALESVESGKALVTNFGYGHANAQALEELPQEVLAGLGLAGDPAETIEQGNLMGPMPERQRQRLVEMWTLIKAGG